MWSGRLLKLILAHEVAVGLESVNESNCWPLRMNYRYTSAWFVRELIFQPLTYFREQL